jgi:hypothetical protein
MPAPLVKRLSVLGALTWRFHATAGASSKQATHMGTSHSSSSSPGGLAMTSASAANGSAAISQPRDPAGGPAALPVLRTARGTEDDGLREMVVDCDGRICAFEYVREGLLVGVVGRELQARKDEGDGQGMNGGVGEPGEVEDESASEDGNHSGSDAEDEAQRVRRRDQMVRLLALKASAMADHLRDELMNFKMPTGLE